MIRTFRLLVSYIYMRCSNDGYRGNHVHKRHFVLSLVAQTHEAKVAVAPLEKFNSNLYLS